LAKAFRNKGIRFMTGAKVEGVEEESSWVKVKVRSKVGGDVQTLQADAMLQAIGFAPRLEGYNLAATGVLADEKTGIAIDEKMRTNVSGIYAIGDVTAKQMLAHTAEAQAVIAAETIAGLDTIPIDYRMIPRATYCQPQIASFGHTEAQARSLGFAVKTSKFPFTANGKAQGLGKAAGFVKIVADAETHELLGASMIGPDVTELLPELTLAQLWDLRAEEVARNIHAHPTLSESLKEACEGISGHIINL
jgi:dihydrolipoamide dehydrogenase